MSFVLAVALPEPSSLVLLLCRVRDGEVQPGTSALATPYIGAGAGGIQGSSAAYNYA